MRRTILRVVIIVLASVSLGMLANTVSPKRIPFITPPKPKIAEKDILPLDEAHKLWESGEAMFLDARAPADYAAGHIANALSLPVEEFEARYPQIAPMLSPDSKIVVYCDGTDCELSHRLAERLRQLQYKNIRILMNGWTSWHNANYPTQTGAAP
jgi:rhodanese-related sulfurtransferase